MSNQVILWSSIILPWFTLFFMKKEEIKRYMPVALFGVVIVAIFSELAFALNFWNVKESVFPFYHVAPLAFGLFPVGILWIYKLTYNRFIYFMALNMLIDFILIYVLDPWITRRGILELVNITSLELYVVDLLIAAVLYGYQMWQEDVLIPYEKSASPHAFQPAAAKPLPEGEDSDR